MQFTEKKTNENYFTVGISLKIESQINKTAFCALHFEFTSFYIDTPTQV